ncbi:MAG: prolyl oligopeptidase family serine peptidase [Halolamina sp.]|uniref:S9 family peptidase n=1 Tax=Halolamina sp. TaxID=1940283 RepID=UPI002FC3D828
MSDEDFLEALASLPSFQHAVASPDGDRVALYYDVTGRNELHVLDVASGDRQQISHGEVPRNARWHLKWGADGDVVYFHDDEAGNEQNDIYAISVSDEEEGAVEQLTAMEGQTVLSDVAENGETLLLGSNRDGQMNVFSFDLASQEATKLTDYERAASPGGFSPSGDRIAYTTNEAEDYNNQDLYVADADGSNPRNLHIGAVGAEAGFADWGSEGSRLLVSDNTENFSRCGIYDLETDDVTWFGDLTAEESPVAFGPDDESFYALRTRDAAIMPIRYDIESGEATELAVPEGVAAFSGAGSPILAEDRVLIRHTTPNRRPDLLAHDPESGETETLLAAEYGDLDRDRFVDADYFTFESHDGLEIGALLYDSGERPSPLVVNPHGGPRAADYRSFGMYTQFLISRGYSVLQVNYRGSTGRGREFVERLYGDWGGGEQADIAEAVRQVTAKEWVDEDRVVVFGGSYGGYSAYWQMVDYPELYAAGIAWIGVTDLADMFENTMPHFRTELMEKYLGTPEENPELYRDRSPVTHVENLTAPLLMVHGVNDRRVPVSQARIFQEALEDAGFAAGEDAAYEYVELGEEGHASSDIDQKIRMLRTLDDFLQRRLPEATTPPDAE